MTEHRDAGKPGETGRREEAEIEVRAAILTAADIDLLAKELFLEMDRLDPEIDEKKWETLSEREATFYVLCVKSILRKMADVIAI